jgi:hypothetical protein
MMLPRVLSRSFLDRVGGGIGHSRRSGLETCLVMECSLRGVLLCGNDRRVLLFLVVVRLS